MPLLLFLNLPAKGDLTAFCLRDMILIKNMDAGGGDRRKGVWLWVWSGGQCLYRGMEEIMDVREKKAKRAGKERKVRAVKLEIKKMRSARKRADHNLVREGISDAYWILGIRRDRKDQALDRLCGSLDPYAGQMTDVGAGMGAGGGFTSADVVVSEGVGF